MEVCLDQFRVHARGLRLGMLRRPRARWRKREELRHVIEPEVVQGHEEIESGRCHIRLSEAVWT